MSVAPSTSAAEPRGIWVGSGEPEHQMCEAEIAAALEEWNRWDHAVVPRERILELNQKAADYNAARYPASWGPDYLAERLGEDLAAALDPVQAVGYAPTGWVDRSDESPAPSGRQRRRDRRRRARHPRLNRSSHRPFP
jgi:hypothetical protein